MAPLKLRSTTPYGEVMASQLMPSNNVGPLCSWQRGTYTRKKVHSSGRGISLTGGLRLSTDIYRIFECNTVNGIYCRTSRHVLRDNGKDDEAREVSESSLLRSILVESEI